MKKYQINIMIHTILFVVLCNLLTIDTVKAAQGDTEGETSHITGTSCNGTDSCWSKFYSSVSDSYEWIFGIRVTMVDGNGTMVSDRSMDYVGAPEFADYINNSLSKYTRCTNTPNHKLAYIKGDATCNWNLHKTKKVISKYLDWLPDIYNQNDAAEEIKNIITGMDQETLENTFFDDIGYDVDSNRENIENHYLIIEPVTMVRLGTYKTEEGYEGSYTLYYGTYHELAPKLLERYFVQTLAKIYMPLAIYSVGNEELGGSGGYNSSKGTYFNKKLKVVKLDKYLYIDSKGRNRVKNDYIYTKQPKIAFGIGIYWLNDFDLEPQTCDFNIASHFTNDTSGPNGEDCCDYVLNNLDTYGLTQSELINKYSRCSSAVVDSCSFNLTVESPSCGSTQTGKISDIKNWDCIYASAYSNDTTIKDYFLVHGGPSSSCSVYCRNELSYMYPSNNMVALAGNYFTIGNNSKSYNTYLNDATLATNIRAATLGPVRISVKRECKIIGDSINNTCKQKAKDAAVSISAPTISFTYESDAYNNPVEYLVPLPLQTNDQNNVAENYYSRQMVYYYYLPFTTYKFVSKYNGVSYKTTSPIGQYPYLPMGPHLPIEFSPNDSQINYKLTITRFNLQNFDNLIIDGTPVATKFISTVDTYISELLENNYSSWFDTVNGIIYFDQSFTESLTNQGYTQDDFLNMSCANTDDYTCNYNNNTDLYYCYNNGTTTNSIETYNNFRACLDHELSEINYNTVSYEKDMEYECYFSVDAYDSGVNVIFRQISLNNPFPAQDGNGRETGMNWCYDLDCENDNIAVDTFITNNRDVETDEVYNELDPLYKIVLTPAIIKEIRQYNDTTSYDDFNLQCSNGVKCKSDFIRKTISGYNFSQYFSGCGIKNKDTDLDCQSNEAW